MRIVFVVSVLSVLGLSSSGALAWTVTKGPASAVTIDLPTGPVWARDGKLTFMPSLEPGYPYVMFSPGYASWRLMGDGPAPEAMRELSPAKPVLGGELTEDVWYNGGAWLLNVFRVDGHNLIGFPHVEYRDPAIKPGQPHQAWKSMAVTYSSDNGRTWTPFEQILTSDKPVPDPVTWGGVGDAGIIYDADAARWRAYYSAYRMTVAESYDAKGRPGTWTKYYDGSFSQPGLGGLSGPKSWLRSLDEVPGAAPAVHWNTYVRRWIMVFHSYIDKNIYISSSIDGITWIKPRLLIERIPGDKRKAWFPTIVGDTSDKIAGQTATLYYLDINANETVFSKIRTRYRVPLTFSRY
jgi:hypothetical protein